MRALIRRIVDDEGGQATTEYVLLLSIAISLVLLLATKFLRPVLDRLKTSLQRKLEQVFSQGNLHRLPIRR